MRRTWGALGTQLGLACIAAGIIIIGLAWNGAASIDFVQGQVPYLLSGGFLGLALVVLGAVLVVVQNSRRDRALVEEQLRTLNTTLSRIAATNDPTFGTAHGDVVVGASSFHDPGCRLVAGKDLPRMTSQAAQAAGLTPCRVCAPRGLASVEAG